MLEYKPNMVLSNEEFDVVGSRPVRHDGADKVTGRARYGADTNLPGLLHGKILRSPHAHAVIKSIDTSAAAAHPGSASCGFRWESACVRSSALRMASRTVSARVKLR